MLEDAGVIVRTVQGRTHLLRLDIDPLAAGPRWLDRQRAAWERSSTLRGQLRVRSDDPQSRVTGSDGRPLPLRIERTFAAPLDAVFDAWTSVELLRRWWPAGPGWTTPVAEVDLRVGGRLRLVMRDPEGNGSAARGRYLDIDRPPGWCSAGAGTPRRSARGTSGSRWLHRQPRGTTTVVLINHGLDDEAVRSHRRAGWPPSTTSTRCWPSAAPVAAR